MRGILSFGARNDEQRQLGAATRQRLFEAESPATLDSGWRHIAASRWANTQHCQQSPDC